MTNGIAWTLAALTGAIAAIGTIRSILEIAGGQSFSPQLIAFYIGVSAILVYFSAGAGGMAAGLILSGLQSLNGGQEVGRKITTAVVVVGVAVGIVIAATLISAGVLFDYEGSDGFARGSFAILGLLVLAGGVFLWHLVRRQPREAAS